MKRILLSVAALAMALTHATAGAQADAKPAAKPKNIVLVSAVGDKFTLVRQREQTGSNVIDNFQRKVLKVSDNLFNNIVLRGLERAVTAEEPGAKLVMMALAAAELENVLPQDRENVAIGKIVAVLEKNPDRASWDKIYVVTPRFMLSQYSGMGAKLQGLGVYIQPLTGGSLEGSGAAADGDAIREIDPSSSGLSDTLDPEGEGTKSKVFVAPFSYLTMYLIDPKTMKIVERNERHDFRKLFDPKSTALDVEKNIDLGFLGENIESLVERSVMKSVRDVEDKARVEVGDIKPASRKPDVKPEAKPEAKAETKADAKPATK